jgi:hypothetical protein
MPAIAALTINDGLAVPVAHTFNPVTTDGAKAQWADRSPSIPSGFRTVSNEVVAPAGSRTTWKWSNGYYVPVVAAINGLDTVIGYNSGSIVLNLRPEASLQERKDLLAYMANSLGLAVMKTSVENLEPFY